jgi:hypothetical protein
LVRSSKFEVLFRYWSTASTEYCRIGNRKRYGSPILGPCTKSTPSTSTRNMQALRRRGDFVLTNSISVYEGPGASTRTRTNLSLSKPRSDMVSKRRNPAFSSRVQNLKVILRSVSHGHFAHAPGRSGKTNGIVIEAKLRAGRRRKLFRQETGWRKPNYASVSIFIFFLLCYYHVVEDHYLYL